MKKIIVIVGQTAVGKTAISIKLAKKIDGEIINGDALQVYKGLNIVTDKIKEEEKQGVVHHLLDFKDVNENYSVQEYQKNIRQVIDLVLSKNKVPIIVGGSGLYIKAALYDYNFEEQQATNIDIEKEYQDYTNQQLHDYLTTIDPLSAKEIHVNNRRRILRAIAIYKESGKTKSEIIATQEHKMLYDCLLIGLTLPKEILNERIDKRIDMMFDEGLIAEIKSCPYETTATKAIGFKEVRSYLNNEITLDEAKELMKIHTHQYAKRQNTWFKHQFDVNWINNDENALDKIIELYNK
ncbi:MAG: tRNA (adenosine(37)-N6)-dimethylallyltransferase MiaA [Candidatus Caccosoma sp.]|nr:tRNA (adenosine(37)-N6)-dimethylallyltransferase MiaA [Candidatus Caccosoma sp.]